MHFRTFVHLFQIMLCILKPHNLLAGCSGQISCWPRQFVTTLTVFKKKSKQIFYFNVISIITSDYRFQNTLVVVSYSIILLVISAFYQGIFSDKKVLKKTVAISVDTKLDGDTTIVEVVDVPDVDDRKVLQHSPETCTLCTCNVPVKVISLPKIFATFQGNSLYFNIEF